MATTLDALNVFTLARAQLCITIDSSLQYQHVDGFGISASFHRAQQIYGKYGLTNKENKGPRFTIQQHNRSKPQHPPQWNWLSQLLFSRLHEHPLHERYASMISNGTQSADFLRVLAPTLKAAGLDTKITCCDAAAWKSQARMLAGIQAADAERLIGVVTSHGCSSPLNGTLNTTLPVWQTEWSDLHGN
jgi:hypothetical protein